MTCRHIKRKVSWNRAVTSGRIENMRRGRRDDGSWDILWFPKMGNPKSWMVYVGENPIEKWMMTRGTPIAGWFGRILLFKMEDGIYRGLCL